MTTSTMTERGIGMALLGAVCLIAQGVAAAERSYPIDCLPDRLVRWDPVASNPQSLFGATLIPGIVLGPPGDSPPEQGSFSVASTGFGGGLVVAFDDVVIEDGPGPDFIVFENAFFKLPLPTSATDDFNVFVEPALVEVSDDGQLWHAFPFDPVALAAATGVPQANHDLYLDLTGLAGLTPTFTGNWTVPNEPAVFDALGTGGVSGAGGDAFDLADVGLSEARFVRLTDLDTQNGFPGPGEGFDLDAVVALNSRPVPAATDDSDGDGLSDQEELLLYGSDPALADSDLDGLDDGREVAACRDPGSSQTEPWLHSRPRLWMVPVGPFLDARWSFMGSSATYDLIRGEMEDATELPEEVELAGVDCVVSSTAQPRQSLDDGDPTEGTVRFYLVRVNSTGDFGLSSKLKPRIALPDCP